MTRRKFIEMLYEYYKELPFERTQRGMEKIKMSLNLFLKRTGEYTNDHWQVTPEERQLIRKKDDKAWKNYLKNYTVDEKDFL